MEQESLQGRVENEIKKNALPLPKKLIVCCDGTWMNSDNGWDASSGTLQNPSNVTRISRAIKAVDDDAHPQIVYYQAGIGTGLSLWDHFVGGGTGMGLSENIREAYAFLADNYFHGELTHAPDSIFLLGFSRGAFTARSLGGFIAAVGILTKRAMPYFYECFMDWEHAGDPDYKPRFFESYFDANPDLEKDPHLPELYKLARVRSLEGVDRYMKAYQKRLALNGLTQTDAKIKAIGVWDTVGSLGIPVNPWFQKVFRLPAFLKDYRWFDTRLDGCVENAFHALALDEYRFPYSPSVWQLDASTKTNLKQVWFPGAHSNIGGSYEDYGTANITLAWMMDQMSGKTIDSGKTFVPKDWIRFDDDYIDECFKHNKYYYESPKSKGKFKAYSGWAMGQIYDSCCFPQSLAGARTRSPGMYHETDYDTGKYTKALLKNTHEFIHSSVRARVDLGGTSAEPVDIFQKIKAWFGRVLPFLGGGRTYRPTRNGGWFHSKGPLRGWKLWDGHTKHQKPHDEISVSSGGIERVHWQYVGKDTPCTDHLNEDRMVAGGYEERLMKHDAEIANEIIFSNNSWHWTKPPHQKPRVAHTF